MNPQNAKVYYYRGLAYANLYSLVIIFNYFLAIEMDPNYAEVYGDRGKTYADLGNYQQAIKDYNKVIALNPRYAAEAYFYRGIAYGKLGNTGQAIKDYDTAIKIDPKDADSYGYRGM